MRQGVTVESALNLDGKRIAVLGGSIQESSIKTLLDGFGIKAQMVKATSLNEVFALTRSAGADAAIANVFFGDYNAPSYGLVGTPVIFQPSRLFYAVGAGRNPDLLGAIDRHLRIWRDDPESIYFSAVKKWRGATIAMNWAVKLTFAASGLFLFVGLIGGVLKYRGIMRSPTHQAPVYIDIAHRAALMYCFAALVMAELLKFSPYPENVQLWITGVPLFFFAAAIAQYFKLGLANVTDNQYQERNFATTWGTWALIVGELGGVGAIVWGFLSTQLFG